MKNHVQLSKVLKVWALMFIIGFLMGIETRPASAAIQADVSVQVFPGTLVVPAFDSANAILVIQNPTADQLVDIEISYFPQDEIIIDMTPPTNTAIPAGSAATWELMVRRATGILATDSIFLVVQYESQPAGGAPPISAVKVVPLAVTATGTAPDKNLMTASIKMSDTTVMEKHSGQAYLILQNTALESLSIDRVEPKHDPALVITTQFSLPVVLAPFDQIAIPYTIELPKNSSIQPGKTLVLFNVSAHTEDRQQQVLAVATQEMNVGVLGENSLLTLLGVPSLLVLPGFLMVATFLMLWRLKYAAVNIDAKSADFWVLAITLSILAAIVYPPLTRLLTRLGIMEQPRDYLNGYGLVDILALWVASILLAVLVFLVVWVIRELIIRMKARKLAEHTPSLTDTEYTILSKLANQGLGAVCERVKVVTTSGETLQGYLLERWSEKPKEVWIGPRIMLTWLKEDDAIKDPIKNLLGTVSSAELERLASLLRRGAKDQNLKLEWSTDSSLKKPRRVPVDMMEKVEPPLPIVQQEM